MSGGQSISPLGNYGFGSSGAYSSYIPMMQMMNGYGYGGMIPDSTMAMMSGYGMNFMNPMMMGMGTDAASTDSIMDKYLAQLDKYNQFAEKIEERKLKHATEMHRKTQLAEVANVSSHDQAFFLAAMPDGDVQHCVRELHDAIRKQNMPYAIRTFFELKQVIYNKFSDYFKTSDGNVNSDEKIKQYICILYSEIAGGYASSGGIKPDLKEDISKYAPTSAEAGFFRGYLGKNNPIMTGDEALNQMFGTGIKDAGYKEKVEKASEWIGRGGQVVTAGGLGAIAGVTALGAAKALTPSWFAKICPDAVASNGLFKWGTKFKTWGKAVGLTAACLDVLWQLGHI